ncbi:MAG: hypothetical protein ACRDRI_10525 [Pseudonocardiaceae bacterium]
MPAPLRMPAQLVLSAIIGRIRIPDPITALAGRRHEPGTAPLRTSRRAGVAGMWRRHG